MQIGYSIIPPLDCNSHVSSHPSNAITITYSILIIIIDRTVTKEPLYPGAWINKDTSWCVIMHYAIANKITYKGITDLLELIKVGTF